MFSISFPLEIKHSGFTVNVVLLLKERDFTYELIAKITMLFGLKCEAVQFEKRAGFLRLRRRVFEIPKPSRETKRRKRMRRTSNYLTNCTNGILAARVKNPQLRNGEGDLETRCRSRTSTRAMLWRAHSLLKRPRPLFLASRSTRRTTTCSSSTRHNNDKTDPHGRRGSPATHGNTEE